MVYFSLRRLYTGFVILAVVLQQVLCKPEHRLTAGDFSTVAAAFKISSGFFRVLARLFVGDGHLEDGASFKAFSHFIQVGDVRVFLCPPAIPGVHHIGRVVDIECELVARFVFYLLEPLFFEKAGAAPLALHSMKFVRCVLFREFFCRVVRPLTVCR